VVDEPEDYVGGDAGGEEEGGGKRGQGGGVEGEVLRLEGVHGGQPDHAAPREVESVVVVGYVDCAEVPVGVSGKLTQASRMLGGGERTSLR